MSIVAAQLIAEVKATGVEETKSQLDSVSGKVKETKQSFGDMLKQGFAMAVWQPIFNGVGQGLSFLKDQLVDSVKDAVAHQQVMTQTAQAIKSTGDASGMTATQLEALAEKFGETTTFSADTTQAGENLLLTFTNIGKNVFPQATQAILDVSQAMHQDLQSSAIQVGKALDDPAKGMSALQRIGVTFSTSQQDAVKAMLKTGDTAGAQKLILKELEKEFGGSAQAAGQTFGGQLSILSDNLEVTKEKIGGALLPVLGNLMNQYVIPLAQKFSDWMFKGGGLQDFQNIIKTIASFLTGTLLPDLNNLLNQYIIPLALQMYDLFIKSGWVHDAFQTIGNIIGFVGPILFNLVTDVGHLVGWFQQAGPQGTILKDVLFGIGAVILEIKIKDLIGNFVTFATQTIPQTIAKIGDLTGVNGLLALKNKAKDAAGADGIGSIGPAATEAEGTVATETTAMEADLAGVGAAAETASGESGIGKIGPAVTEAEATVETETGAAGMAGAFAAVAGPLGIGAILVALPMIAQGVHDATVKAMDDLVSQVKQKAQQAHDAIVQQLINQNYQISLNMDIRRAQLGLPSLNEENNMPDNEGTPVVKGHYASGGSISSPGWYGINERGFEGVSLPGGGSPAYLPAGTQVIPNNQLGGGSSPGAGGTAQPVVLTIDGIQFARLILPYLPQQMRSSIGLIGV